MPRSGSRALALLAIFAVLVVAVAALARDDTPPTLDPSPAPSVALDEPSTGRLLTVAEARSQLGPDWTAARITLVRDADVADLTASAGPIDPDRVVLLAVREDAGRYELRVYDAASGLRLATLTGNDPPPH